MVDRRNGLEVWRTYLGEYEPKVRNRHGGMLTDLLGFSFAGTDLLELDQWEAKVREYETASGETVGENVKCDTILNRMKRGTPLRDHRQLNADRLTT